METLITNHNPTVGEIVSENYQAAAVFEKHQIDYCCGGKKTLDVVCRERQLDMSQLLKEIEETTAFIQMPPSQNAAKWNLSFLINYIVETHHQYVKGSDTYVDAIHRKNCIRTW